MADHSFPWLRNYPKNLEWDTTFEGRPLYALLDLSAEKFPDRPLINFLGKRYSYSEIAQHVTHAAAALQAQGVKKGTRVGLFLPNTPTYVIFYFAILKAGGTVVNFSPLYARKELERQILDSNTTMMVTLDLEALFPKVHSMLKNTCLEKIIVHRLKSQLPTPKNFFFSLLKSKEVERVQYNQDVISAKDLFSYRGQLHEHTIHPDTDVALIQYTGGTTGDPKGAVLTHSNVFINACQADMWYERDRDSREKILAALPFFHVFAMTAIMNLGIKCGAEIVMMFPRFNAQDAIKMIAKHGITFFPAVPTIYNLIANEPNVRNHDLSSIRACLSGGAPLPIEVKREFESLTGCVVVEAYGLTETAPGATSNPIKGVNKAGSIGLPFPGTRIKVVSLEDPEKTMPVGERGEICIEGPQVMQGYLNRPSDTEKAFSGDYFRTGDVGYMDAEGYVFLVDRIKDLILCSGYNVYPRTIEEAIYQHDAVDEVTVIGIADKKRGQTPKAFVKLKAGQTLEAPELQSFLKDLLSPIEIPKEIEFRDELPKTIIGKLSKKELVAESDKNKAVSEG